MLGEFLLKSGNYQWDLCQTVLLNSSKSAPPSDFSQCKSVKTSGSYWKASTLKIGWSNGGCSGKEQWNDDWEDSSFGHSPVNWPSLPQLSCGIRGIWHRDFSQEVPRCMSANIWDQQPWSLLASNTQGRKDTIFNVVSMYLHWRKKTCQNYEAVQELEPLSEISYLMNAGVQNSFGDWQPTPLEESLG